jgi:hypothetical protein
LYTAAPSAVTTTADAAVEPEGPNLLAEQETGTPHSPVKAGGEAAGSPTPSVAAAPEEKGAISSPEDVLSVDESPCGDGPTVPVELPVIDSLPKRWTFDRRAERKQGRGRRLASLARRLTCMSLGQEPEVPENRPVEVPESLIATLARDPPKRLLGGRVLTLSRNKASDENKEESDAAPPPQGPNPPPGGGDSDPLHNDGDDEEEEKEKSCSDSEMGEADEDEPEDPDKAGMGKFYAPQTPRGKSMVKMFHRFCDLPKRDANTIIVYFGMYSVARLAAFPQDHWKDAIAQWQKRHPN